MYPTLCHPIDGSPPGSPVLGILQARTLEWVDISFSNAWNWKVKVKTLSCVQLLATPWTAAYQAPPSMGLSRQEHWSGLPLPSLQGRCLMLSNYGNWGIFGKDPWKWSDGQSSVVGQNEPLKSCTHNSKSDSYIIPLLGLKKRYSQRIKIRTKKNNTNNVVNIYDSCIHKRTDGLKYACSRAPSIDAINLTQCEGYQTKNISRKKC